MTGIVGGSQSVAIMISFICCVGGRLAAGMAGGAAAAAGVDGAAGGACGRGEQGGALHGGRGGSFRRRGWVAVRAAATARRANAPPQSPPESSGVSLAFLWRGECGGCTGGGPCCLLGRQVLGRLTADKAKVSDMCRTLEKRCSQGPIHHDAGAPPHGAAPLAAAAAHALSPISALVKANAERPISPLPPPPGGDGGGGVRVGESFFWRGLGRRASGIACTARQ
jgi:hypothetical protein